VCQSPNARSALFSSGRQFEISREFLANSNVSKTQSRRFACGFQSAVVRVVLLTARDSAGKRVLFNLNDDARGNNCAKTIAFATAYLRAIVSHLRGLTARHPMNFRANDAVFASIFNIAPYLFRFSSRSRSYVPRHAYSAFKYAALSHIYSDAEIPAPSTTSTTQSPYYATLSTKKNGNLKPHGYISKDTPLVRVHVCIQYVCTMLHVG